jgi:hypothetical protein
MIDSIALAIAYFIWLIGMTWAFFPALKEGGFWRVK